MKMGLLRERLNSTKRYKKIAEVLVKHGFGFLVREIHLQKMLPIHKKIFEFGFPKDIKTTRAQRARLVLEDLGPTFMKVGQVLSTRPDLLPYDFVEEFEKLTDDAPAFEFKKVKEIIEKEYGRLIEDVFKSFEEKPVAAASLGQVHRAVLKNGDLVAVKIQRPNIERIIEQDIKILKNVARLMENNLPELVEWYKPTIIIDEYEQAIRNELNYRREARNLDKFSKNFKYDNTVKIPGVYWDHTTERVLVLEFIDGEKFTDWIKKNPSLEKRQKIAGRLLDAYFKQIFKYGFFQADPHSGNLFIMKNDVIGIIDFGMVSSLNDNTKRRLADMFVGLFQKDAKKITRSFLKMGMLSPETNIKKLERDLESFVQQYYGSSMEQMRTDELLRELNIIFIQNRVHMTPNISLFMKTMAGTDGLVRKLDKTYTTTKTATRFIRGMIGEQTHPGKLWAVGVNKFLGLSDHFSKIPERMDHVLEILERGVVNLELQPGFERMNTNMEKTSNKLSFSLVIAAFIIASALIINMNIGPTIWGLPALGVSFFTMTGFIGFLWMIVSLYRGEV
jgi:ubiquinone biosynthesis protein